MQEEERGSILLQILTMDTWQVKWIQIIWQNFYHSGCLIRPCEGGGSVIHIVDHLNLEPWSVSEDLRPLYESSTLLAQSTTLASFGHLRQVSQEISKPTVTSWGRRPAALRALGQRLSKGFNEAVNGFADEGWQVTESDGVDDVTVFVNLAPTKVIDVNQMYAAHGFPLVSNAVLCAKASMLLQFMEVIKLENVGHYQDNMMMLNMMMPAAW